ncbi:amino acid permease [Paenibacillus sp. KS-LC4]|uniref:amino acid permease n=1 Tax=Paenibacillus sp. KS-LC4 TaxID=2979727 RepID=UPI0030CD34C0
MFALVIGLALFFAVCAAALAGAVKAQQSIKSSSHQSMTAYATYIQMQQDKHDLNLFGLAQQLRRKFGTAASFGLSFNTMGLCAAALLFLAPALQQGGPVVVGIGIPLAALFALMVSASLAELSSAIPTAGGVYHWSSALGGRVWGWHAGWFHMAGYMGLLLLSNLLSAFLLDSLLAGWLGYVPSIWTKAIIALAMVVIQAALHSRGVRLLAILLRTGLWLQLIAAIAAIGMLVALYWPGAFSPELLFTLPAYNGEGKGQSTMGMIAGFLLLQKLFLGMDSAAQGAEETSDPRIRVPWAIYLSTAYTFIIGFVLLAVLTLVWPGFSYGGIPTGGAVWFAGSLLDAVSRSPLAIVLLVILLYSSSSSVLIACSRLLYSLTRDKALPFSRQLSGVHPATQSPRKCVWLAAVGFFIILVTCCLLIPEHLLTAVVPSFTLICLYTAYAIPIALALRAGKKHKLLMDAPWHLGRWSAVVNITALVWLLLSVVLAAIVLGKEGIMGAGAVLLVSALLDLRYRRRHLETMQSRLNKTHGEIIRIERKFELTE